MKLIHGECLEEMDKLIEQGVTVDAIITDPPYQTTACAWDKLIPFDAMWERLNELIKPNGAIVLFGSEPFSSALRMSNIKNYKYDIYWEKEKPTNIFQLKRRIGKSTENISLFYNKQPTYNPQMTKHTGKLVSNKPKGIHKSIVSGDSKQKVTKYEDTGWRYPTDVLKIRREKLGSCIHPTQKPVALMEYLIKTYTNENETVLDFTMGSGTTGVACVNTKRKFIGIELDGKYFDIAETRIENARNELNLFETK